MNCIIYKALADGEVTPGFLSGFNRYQDVKRCWRRENGEWMIKSVPFTEMWDGRELDRVEEKLRGALSGGGAVLAAFDGERVAGFASLDAKPFGSALQYVLLTFLHVSHEYRGRGIGKKLFAMALAEAGKRGGSKLYISAHSSEESQAFYHSVGCVEAQEYDRYLSLEEPCDCQMECLIKP